MSLRYAMTTSLLSLAFFAAGSGAAWADNHQSDEYRAERRQDRYQQDRYQTVRYQRDDQRDGDLPASVRRIQRETGGEVLKAQPIQRDGREVYRVKVLTPQGRIRVYEDEPAREVPPRRDLQREGASRQDAPHRDPQRRDPPPPSYPRRDRHAPE